ncbi:MAG: 4,5-DOPA dioxygenase extradiol [Chloroflexi bacterium]|nr:4,5-DOPA dioxygenase extradiol [Chloroflexota bacterium]
MGIDNLNQLADGLSNTVQMPVLFVGHGSPMNAIEDNEFSRGWREIGKTLPRPNAILCISAHWETRGTQVTAMEKPPTIHDFGGFPRELFAAQYPAPGSPWLARETKDGVTSTAVAFDDDWGLDHGCWSVLKQMFPDADVPVVQMSLDYTQPAQYHYDLAKELAPLRRKGVLILGSGNMVHNLRRVALVSGTVEDFNRPYGFDWAIEANELFKKLIDENHHRELANYKSLGKAVQLAVPTLEHYLPMLYALGLKAEDEAITYFNDKPLAGSLTMTSLKIDRAARE